MPSVGKVLRYDITGASDEEHRERHLLSAAKERPHPELVEGRTGSCGPNQTATLQQAREDSMAADTHHSVAIEDLEYQRQNGRALLARLYRPSGPGPFPASLQVHGGAWVNKDRTDNDYIAKALAESGILVASIDFRMPPEAPYPASLADINLGLRWLKARARSLGSRPDWVGAFGTSSGGHQVLLGQCEPTTRATALCRSPRRLRSMRAWPSSSPAGACSTHCCVITSPRRSETKSSSPITTLTGEPRRR